MNATEARSLAIDDKLDELENLVYENIKGSATAGKLATSIDVTKYSVDVIELMRKELHEKGYNAQASDSQELQGYSTYLKITW